MGNPVSGEIYEGLLRPGDVELTQKQVDELFPEIPLSERVPTLKKMLQEQARAHGMRAADVAGVPQEMPRYQSHKTVWALKIAEILPTENGATIVPADEGFAPFPVDASYCQKHEPQVGGYFVVYKDGYKSYSPAQAFEEGYTRI